MGFGLLRKSSRAVESALVMPRRSTMTLAILAGAAIVSGACMGGCSYSTREAYFDSRAALVEPRAGDGSTRLVLWPAGAWGRSAIALADRSGSVSDITPRTA